MKNKGLRIAQISYIESMTYWLEGFCSESKDAVDKILEIRNIAEEIKAELEKSDDVRRND